MTIQEILGAIVGVVSMVTAFGGGAIWIGKLQTNVASLQKDFDKLIVMRSESMNDYQDFKLSLSDTYARKDDVMRSFDKIEKLLERMYDEQKRGFENVYEKLDRKADK